MQIYKTLALSSIILVLTAVSVLCAVMLAPSVSDTAYTVVKIDAEIHDEDAVSLLDSGGIRDIVSSSTQTVFLDDFGEIKQIPLHQYDDYVFDFDPRNDGYAEKLERFFSQHGKRFIFIPLKKQEFSPQRTIKHIEALLESIPHETEFIGVKMPPYLSWALFFAAFAGTLCFFKKLRPVAGIFFPMSGFLFWGPSGFLLSALLVVFFSVLISSLSEWFAGRRYGTKRSVFEHISLYRYSVISAAGFFLLYIVAAVLTGVSLLYSVLLFSALSVLFGILLRRGINRSGVSQRVRFLPVPITGEHRNILHHCISALPFSAAAVTLLVLSFFMHYTDGVFAFDQSRLVSQTDFEEHVRFQRNFSFIPLGEKADNYQYKIYQLGDDGLVAASLMPYSETPELLDTVFFPLKDVTDHIQGSAEQTIRWVSPEIIVPLLFFSVFVFFAVFLEAKHKGRKKIISMYNDKRIAA